MGFNYAKKNAEFEREWAALREQYEGLGMSQDAYTGIQEPCARRF